MGKKKNTASSGAATSSTGPKATGTAPKLAAAARDIQCNWTASTVTKRDEKKMRNLELISDDEKYVHFLDSDSRPNPRARFTVSTFSVPWVVSSSPRISSTPLVFVRHSALAADAEFNSAHHFIIVCEAFLGIDPQWGLWKKIFFVKRYSGGSGPYVVGGVGFIVQKEINYFNFPMKEFVQGWRSKWFYLRDRPASGHRSDLPKFTDVLEATPKKSWQNILTAKEKPVADDFYKKVLDMKNVGGHTMIAPEVSTAQPPKKPSGVFADEDELLFESDEGEVAPPPLKKAKTGSEKEAMAEVEGSTLPEGAPVAPPPPKMQRNDVYARFYSGRQCWASKSRGS
ncbi:hypothetical protein QYE76_012742 [Lolium multiflorum]|uniref:Uncharacterized protein n=1 Tax=Lolium multiflorum TaxID=4521 RepID=A0AAD8U1N9_LOLMU|nr:hypothetical protein QYE76_012742 [Lolium multiflorum]